MPEMNAHSATDAAAEPAHECCGKHVELDMAEVAEVLSDHASDPGALITVLQETQKRFGYLPKAALKEIATSRGVPYSHVYGVATFYSQFHLRPRGDRVVRICHGTACHVRGAPEVTRAVSEELGVKVGETTDDLTFTLESVACVGCCGLAPVMLVDEETYGQLDVVEARRIATHFREESERERSAGAQGHDAPVAVGEPSTGGDAS
jgi:NADH:ubiquinone oxidoreductase subunit E